ncbi:hypothetical protein DL766_000980 [Monosporascus sp. MC13-8B]|uniref:CSC1/OSCA1-like 7TM region domain-containing protein n=1 Tax=Monosporascus cannonballus TaxID=155416 RepID=A0ABY0H3I5_9PEZI|nr:hypothetical protein DL762_005895 [Monosporascus cannonballus]RYO92700.1 hypothetical protein DL763_004613 [Monosporascus cannonballus]RYP38402.1 hypothetical protein DL766_000980 [Monosporascus sp. MC13-8B]
MAARDNDTEPDYCRGIYAAGPGSKDIYVQSVISLGLGFTALFAFCILRPRWKSLYAARKRRSDPQIALPVLPDSFLGWIPALYRVTEEQVLASAGLDAFVFLNFFKMSLRLFSAMLFFALAVLWPIHKMFDTVESGGDNDNDISNVEWNFQTYPVQRAGTLTIQDDKDRTYLWAYLVFTWFFSLLTIYFMDTETTKVVKIRQDYLGTQSTVTDRTFRLVGIPKDLRSEGKIKQFVENLEIGNVKSVTLCRDWAKLDALMAERETILRKLEEAWTAFLAQSPKAGVGPPAPANPNGDRPTNDDEESQESSRLLARYSLQDLIAERKRPEIRIRFGFLKLRSRSVDALDYYEEKLRRLDEKIQEARRKEYRPTATAFVTMDSIAACQMAVQAVVDPRPGRLLTKPAPSPSDVIWRNTYRPFYRRRFQSWSITIFISFLSLIWLLIVAALAQLLSICNIRKIAPSFGKSLESHETTGALVRTGLPTLIVSLLNILVPYLYDYLSNRQGMVSQGDVELSVISKNFFFVFFNIFVVYAVSGSAALSQFWQIIRDSLRDTRTIALGLAKGISDLNNFYLNFIMLQGLGLFPFKLLQFGDLTLYPIYRMGAKTPRDFARLMKPTLFNYGFYLPTALLVFILCLVYSILPGAHLVLLLGLCYFGLGYLVYKYQLLYSMDQPQHATGKAWQMICERIVLGLLVFQVVMISILVLRLAFFQAVLVGPLLLSTFWYLFYHRRRFTPLTKFIALRSIKRHSDPGTDSHPEQDPAARQSETRLARRLSTIDEDKEKGMRFVNPSLVAPLEQPWIYTDPPPPLIRDESAITIGSDTIDNGNSDNGGSDSRPRNTVSGMLSGTSSFSLGDTHIWRENGNGDGDGGATDM